MVTSSTARTNSTTVNASTPLLSAPTSARLVGCWVCLGVGAAFEVRLVVRDTAGDLRCFACAGLRIIWRITPRRRCACGFRGAGG